MLLMPFRYSMSLRVIFVLSAGERKLGTRNSVLSYWDNQQPWNVSAVFILSFLLREITYIISSYYVDMTVCITSRYVHRNKKEVWLYVKDTKIYFLVTPEKNLRRAPPPPWQIPGYAPVDFISPL